MIDKLEGSAGVKSIDDKVAMDTEEEQQFRAAVAEGLAQLDRGEFVPGTEVLAWVKSWGSENELPRPKVRLRKPV
jgi:predicted transcriptional regulator